MSKSSEKTVINPFKPVINRLPKGVSNRYYLTLLLFVLWLVIFDKANVFEQYGLQSNIKRLENDKLYYQNKLKEVQQERIDMENDKEKFAREHYFMKANDEDVFIIEDKTKESLIEK